MNTTGQPSIYPLSNKNIVLVIYILMTMGIVFGGMLSLVGLIMAYMCKRLFSLESEEFKHLTYIIRTFWICSLFVILGFLLVPLYGVGFLIIAGTSIWAIYRYVAGAYEVFSA